MAHEPFPIIDISLISQQDHQVSIARQIAQASQTWGFLLLKNHGVAPKSIDHTFSLARKFFVDIPEDQKTPWPIDDNYTGYVGSLSDGPKDDKASMWFSGRPDQLSTEQEALPPFWRQYIQDVEYFKHQCHGLVIRLLECFALAMDLSPDYFSKAHAEDAGNGNRFRMICYPAHSHAPEPTRKRMSAHSDSGSVTLLFQTCAGLEVESPTGEWVSAPHVPGHILVNLGDALAFWSGARFKATKHRVTFEGVPHNLERLTMAYFGTASPETVLEPIRSDDYEEKLKNYNVNGVVIQPGITVGQYEELIMKSIYGKGVAPTAVTEAHS